MTPMGRQTILPEYSNDWPFHIASEYGKKTHYVHDDDVDSGYAGRTYCGHFNVACEKARTDLTVLNAVRNPCSMCLRRIDDEYLSVLAQMATVCSQHEITVDDIRTNE